jgi:hypothetical protein
VPTSASTQIASQHVGTLRFAHPTLAFGRYTRECGLVRLSSSSSGFDPKRSIRREAGASASGWRNLLFAFQLSKLVHPHASATCHKGGDVPWARQRSFSRSSLRRTAIEVFASSEAPMSDEPIVDTPVLVKLPLGAIVTFATQCARHALDRVKHEWRNAPGPQLEALDKAIGICGVDHWFPGDSYQRALEAVNQAHAVAMAANANIAAEAMNVLAAAARCADFACTSVALYPGESVEDDDGQWYRFKHEAAFCAAGATWFAKEIAIVEPIETDFDAIVGVLKREKWPELQKTPPWILFTADASIERAITLAINDLCVALCCLIAEHRIALAHIEWRDLERVVATALKGIGFEIELTPGAKDGGKDIIARVRLRGKHATYYIEIKHWRSGKQVGAQALDHFIEVNLKDQTNGGLFLSTSGYSPSIYSQAAEIKKTRVRFGDDIKVITLCQHFVQRRGQAIWLAKDVLPEILFEKTHGYASKHADDA